MSQTLPQKVPISPKPAPENAAVVGQAVVQQTRNDESASQPFEPQQEILPLALARPFLALLSQHALPPAQEPDGTSARPPQEELLLHTETSMLRLTTFQAELERLLQHTDLRTTVLRALETSQHDHTTATRSAPLGPVAPPSYSDSTTTLLEACTAMLTPVLIKALEAALSAVVGTVTPPPPSSPVLSTSAETPLYVLSPAHYHAVRDALAQAAFITVEDTPWPTARLAKGRARGHAQLRPVIIDQQPFLSPEEVEHWRQIMERQQGELSDLDADTLDALSALWLAQAKDPNDDATATVDDFLALRGLVRNPGGQGRRGGYRAHQRMAMWQSLGHIQNLWLTMAELETYDGAATPSGKRRRKPTTQAIQSRAFTITDLLGQLRIDGFMNVEQFIFRPGKVFAHFLAGPGRQTALLSAKALAYDPYRQTWAKRLTRYLSWQWRCEAYSGNYLQPFAVTTLLTAVGHPVNYRRLAWQRTHLENTLDTIQHDDVMATWQYAQEQEDWAKSTILIEPPDIIREQYQHLAQHERPRRQLLPDPQALGERLKHRRQTLGLSQIQAAEQLDLHQGHFSRLERGQVTPSPALRKRLEAWCAGEK